ncbi:MAG: tRNA pseudouridine(55) synthase TruB [Clostridia bacterium]|nr:tRNA pseudouridine(55) synthase TruB [Clostridia bacterium]
MSDNREPVGILLIDKESGWTSFDVCAKLRSILKTKKIGHAGTLDPIATGLMTVLVGGATKAADILPLSDKRYLAAFKLGVVTDTLDITGSIIKEEYCEIDEENLLSAMENFKGEIMQLPPMYSAVHVDGQRLYELARKGIEVEREARKVEILHLELVSFDEESCEGQLDVICSKGTYIRSLVADIGDALGCGAVLTALRRTEACGFSVNDAAKIEEIKDDIFNKIIPVDKAFESCKAINITSAQMTRYKNGDDLMAERLKLNGTNPKDGEIFRVYCDEFIGLGKFSDGSLRPWKRLT